MIRRLVVPVVAAACLFAAPVGLARAWSPASLVNPFSGTAAGAPNFGTGGGAANTFPGAVAPFGMLAWSPNTIPDTVNFAGGYSYPDHELSAGRMLEACGLKGHRIGGAQISPKHANFIENAGGARTADALALMTEARRRALDEYGVELVHEVEFLGPIELPST